MRQCVVLLTFLELTSAASLLSGRALSLSAEEASFVRTEATLDTWQRIGRTFLASDPEKAAGYFVQRFGARVLESASQASASDGYLRSENVACAEIVSVELPAPFDFQRIQFIKDSRKPSLLPGSMSKESIILSAATSYETMADDNRVGGDSFAPLVDNHDGYRPFTSMNLTGALSDPRGTWCEKNPASDEAPLPPGYDALILRGYIPGTLCSWDSPAAFIEQPVADGLYTDFCGLEEKPTEPEDKCRNTTLDGLYTSLGYYSSLGWYKTTILTFDPQGAQALSIQLFGGTYLNSPYPEDKSTSNALQCPHRTAWVFFNLTGTRAGASAALLNSTWQPFMFHFVESNDTTAYGLTKEAFGMATWRDFTAAVLNERRLEAGIFDTWMYNSGVFRVPSLLPYKRRLAQLQLPYLERLVPGALDASELACSLWLGIPGSSFSWQLISSVGCDRETTPTFDVCSAV